MTPADFAAAISRTRLRERAAEAARLILVDGLTAAETARRLGITHPTARVAAARVTEAYRAMIGCPAGWMTVTVCIPQSGYAELLDTVARLTAGR